MNFNDFHFQIFSVLMAIESKEVNGVPYGADGGPRGYSAPVSTLLAS